MRMPVTAFFALGTLLCLACLPFALMMAGLSVMETDGGNTPEARMIFYLMCGWPLSAIAGPLAAWTTRRRFGNAALLWFLPCLAYAVIVVAMILAG
ncbi:MAG: hypothetical protein ACRECY_06890 [Phyllobacterium sp.]